MFERIEITNFQRHRDLIIDLDPQVTVLVGPSGAGKSSVLRALTWLCTNRPGGEEFITHGEESCTVRLVVDGKGVSRSRGKSHNTYNFVGIEYSSFGTTVPDPIAELLNVGPVNFQGQHDPAFWFSKSPGEVSRELNAIVNLGLIDSTLANVATELRRARATEEVSQERLTQARKRRDGLAWVEDADRHLHLLEAKQDVLDTIREQKDKLERLLDQVEEMQRAVNIRIPDSEISRLDQLVVSIREVKDEKSRLELLLGEIVTAEEELCEAREEARQNAAALAKKMGKTCPLCGTTLTTKKKTV